MTAVGQLSVSIERVQDAVSRLRDAAHQGKVRLMEHLRDELLWCARIAGVDVRAPIRELEAKGYRRGLEVALEEAERAARRGLPELMRDQLTLARHCAFHMGAAVDGRIAAIEAYLR